MVSPAMQAAQNSKLSFSNRNQPMIENAILLWRNFSGAAKTFTPEGKRTVNIVLNEEIFAELAKQGYNVKRKAPKEGREDDGDLLVLEAEARYSPTNRDPQIVMISPTRNSRTLLDATTVGALDFAVIANADVVLNPYKWGPNARGESGVKAYLEQAFITIEENAFEAKYAEYESEEYGDNVDRDGQPQTVRFD